MLIFLFCMTFFAGLGFGYMVFHNDIKDIDYVVVFLDGTKMHFKFKCTKSESWDPHDGIGKRTHEYVELVKK